MTRRDRRERELPSGARRSSTPPGSCRAEGWESVTTRRLADRIEYSQPVLYSHFDGKVAIVTAVALEDTTNWDSVAHRPPAGRFGRGRTSSGGPPPTWSLPVRTRHSTRPCSPCTSICGSQRPTQLLRYGSASSELRDALAPVAGVATWRRSPRSPWSGLHGLATLSRAGRLRPDFYDQRLSMLMDQLSPTHS